MAIQGKATDEGLHLLKANLKSKCLSVYILTSLHGDIDFELDPTKSLNQYLSEWQSLGGEYFEREIDYVYFDNEDVITFEILFKVFDDIPTTGKWISGGIIVWDDGLDRKSVAIFSYKFYASGVADFNLIVKVSLNRESTPVTYYDSDFVSQSYVDVRMEKLWEFLQRYGIEQGETAFEDKKPVSFEDLFYYFYLENSIFMESYYDKFVEEDTINIIQGNAVLDKKRSKYVISEVPCVFETDNVLVDASQETYRNFQVHVEATGSVQVEYSIDDGETWETCGLDTVITTTSEFESLKIRFTFSESCDFNSFGVLFGIGEGQIRILDIEWNPEPTCGGTSLVHIVVIGGEPTVYTLVSADPDVQIEQDQTDPSLFHVTFPDYSEDTIVKFEASVTAITSSGSYSDTYSENVLVKKVEVGDRGVFAGGILINGDNFIYLDSLEYITISILGDAQDFGGVLTVARGGLAATSNGTKDRGIFGGGNKKEVDYIYFNVIDCITISNEGVDAEDFGDLTLSRTILSAVSNGTKDRGVFGGGVEDAAGSCLFSNVLDYVTISSKGDAQDFGDLFVTSNSNAQQKMGATSNGTKDRGVFGGIWADTIPNRIIEYITIPNVGSNASNFGELYLGRQNLTATSNGINDRGVFGGGMCMEESCNGEFTSILDYITISTQGDALSFGDLTLARQHLTSTSNGVNERGVFGGGETYDDNGNYTFYSVMDFITISNEGTDASSFGELQANKSGLAATSNT